MADAGNVLFSKYKNEAVNSHEDVVKATAEKVLSQTIPWEGYKRAELIKDQDLELIKKYDKKSEDVKKSLIQSDGETYAELFLQLLVGINKEETLQYLLTLIDQLLQDNPQSVHLFLRLSVNNKEFPFEPLLRLLNRSNLDWFTYAKASSVTATLMASSSTLPEESVKVMCNWVREQLRKSDEKDVCNAISALQKLGRKDEFRTRFASEDGLNLLAGLIEVKSKSVQILYQSIYCVWLLSYNSRVAEQINQTKVIQTLADILKRTGTHDKVVRMCLATLRNLVDSSKNNEQMIDAGLIKPLENLKNKPWADDDMIDDLNVLNEKLQANLTELSTFEVFKKELQSGNLEWTPAHRSEKFWKENIHHFEEDNYKTLQLLKDILNNSGDALVLSVACFDVGEFARFHPRGRNLIQQLGLKLPLMKHMEDRNADVRKQALLAVQKLMVTHWEFLSQ